MSNGKDRVECMSPGGWFLILFLPFTSWIVSIGHIDFGVAVVLNPGCTLQSPGRCLKRKLAKPHPAEILAELSGRVFKASQVIPTCDQS